MKVLVSDTHEAEFQELAGRPGMEALRRECEVLIIRGCHAEFCPGGCQGRGWLPLPEAERLGALVNLAPETTLRKVRDGSMWWALGPKYFWHHGPTHWAALTRALLAAVKK